MREMLRMRVSRALRVVSVKRLLAGATLLGLAFATPSAAPPLADRAEEGTVAPSPARDSLPLGTDAPVDTEGSAPLGPTQATPAMQGTRAADTLEAQEKNVRGGSTRSHRDKEVSRVRLDRETLKYIPAAQGDPMRALSTLPGTTTQNDMSVRPFVRGGKSEETQVLWEGIPLLQPYHFGSLYSIFNIESLQDLTLYSGGFPAEMGNALSGALYMHARPAPIDSLSLSADLSLLRGNAYAGVPLIKDKLGISLAYQAFWYDWVFNRGLDLAALARDDADFNRDKRDIEKYLDLPNFKDLQMGLAWKLSDRLQGEYTGILSRDDFGIKNGGVHQYVNGQEVSPDYYAWDLFYGESGDVREKRVEPDTTALVTIRNNVHSLAFHWKPAAAWQVDQTLAYQSQDWQVGFYDNNVWTDSVTPQGGFAGYREHGPSTYKLGIRNRTYDWKLDAKGYLTEKMKLQLGASQSYRESRFTARLPRPIFETIVNGNVDALDALGYFNPEGTLIRTPDSLGSSPDYLNELPNLVKFDREGFLSANFLAAYVSGEYSFDPAHRLLLGLRAESDTYSNRPFLSPRAAYFQSLGGSDELTLAAGLYSQSDYPFQIRSVNLSLEPEKAFHFNLEWTHAFTRRYRLECDLYQKNYFDLVVPFLINTGRIDWHSDFMDDWGMIDSATFVKMAKPQQDSVLQIYGLRTMGYRNGGTGKAAGLEISFHYNPNPTWGGWFSAEAGYSKRQDSAGTRAYDYRYSRPWAFNWINHFKLPNRFGLALRGRYAAGLPYTKYVAYQSFGSTEDIGGGFSEDPADPKNDTALYIGRRNGGRYAAYSRWDLRLSREFPIRGHKMEAYFELWNAFNAPNFLMRDEATEKWKFVDLNYPVPILFVGLSGRW
ncbi:MAG: TonB-dependent receptor [Fibrobacteria bacterium]